MPNQRVEYVLFNSGVQPDTCKKLMQLLSVFAQRRTSEVHLAINTHGGNVAAGIALYNFLNSMPYEITAYNIGNVSSIGNAVFLAAGRRYACAQSTFMFHGVGFDRQACRLEEKELRHLLSSLYADQERIGEIIALRTSFTSEEVKDLFREARFISSTVACEKGFIDAIQDFRLPSGANLRNPLS